MCNYLRFYRSSHIVNNETVEEHSFMMSHALNCKFIAKSIYDAFCQRPFTQIKEHHKLSPMFGVELGIISEGFQNLKRFIVLCLRFDSIVYALLYCLRCIVYIVLLLLYSFASSSLSVLG
jgi:hypothetical protein